MANLSNFEQMILHYLTNPHPSRKFRLWQNTAQGRICGFYFMRISVAFSQRCAPGWYYHLETGEETTILHEDALEEVANA